jgi:hypothetical protein
MVREKYGTADAAPSDEAPEESLYLATAHNLETMEREAASLKKRDDFQVFVAYGNYERVRTGLSDVDMPYLGGAQSEVERSRKRLSVCPI